MFNMCIFTNSATDLLSLHESLYRVYIIVISQVTLCSFAKFTGLNAYAYGSIE